jgi:hypothetical protein
MGAMPDAAVIVGAVVLVDQLVKFSKQSPCGTTEDRQQLHLPRPMVP